MKQCPNCGAVWPDGETFCHNCGEVLPQAAPSASPQPPAYTQTGSPRQVPAASKGRTVILIVAIVAAAAAVIGGMFYLSHRNDRYEEKLSLGNRYYMNRQYEKAIKAYDAASKIKPRAPQPYENKAQVYLAQKKYGRALKTINRIAKDDRTATAEMITGDIKTAQGNRSAKKYYQKALTKIPGEAKQTKDKTERREILNLYQEIFATVHPTDGQIKTATETIEKYGDDEMLMGVTNNNATLRRSIVGEVDSVTEGGSFVAIGNNTYHLFENRLLKDDVNGKTTTVHRHAQTETFPDMFGLGNLNGYMGYLYFTYASQYNMGEGTAEICRIRPDGTGFEKLATVNKVNFCELVVYDGRLYFSYNVSALSGGMGETVLLSYNLNGKDKKTLLQVTDHEDSSLRWQFAIAQKKLYMPGKKKILKIDLETNRQTTISTASYDIGSDLFNGFTISDGKMYALISDEDTVSYSKTLITVDLDTQKVKKIKTISEKNDNYFFGVFADQGQYYLLNGRYDDLSDDPPGLQVENADGDTLLETDDYYRAALMDGEIWVEDSSGKMHYYALDDSADT